MHVHSSPLLRSCGVFAAAALSLSLARADEPKAASASEDLPVFENHIVLGGQYNGVSGDKSAFSARNWTARDGFGGVEEFRYGYEPSKDVSVEVDGHALLRNNDYLAHLHASKDQVGSVDFGFKEFRTFYDGVGGYFPLDGAWFPLSSRNLHVDRSKFWAEAKLNFPNAPVITFRYSYETRTGKKDTTIWGDSDKTGIPIYSNSALNPVSADRKIVANYLALDEAAHHFEATAQKNLGKTNLVVSLIGERINNLDTRHIERYPGEVKPYPAIPSSPVTLVPDYKANNETWGYDQAGTKSNTFAALAKAETVFSEKLTVDVSLKWEHAAADITGYRPLWVNLASSGGVGPYLGGYITGGRAPGAYQNLVGTTSEEAIKGVVGVEYKATSALTLEGRLKGEQAFIHGSDTFSYQQFLLNTATRAVTNNSLGYSGRNSIKDSALVPEIGFRYTGIKDLSFFGDADYRYAPGYEKTNYVTTSSAYSSDNVMENHGHYNLGASWTPTNTFTFRGETYYKDHTNKFEGYGSSVGSLYVLGYQMYGAKLTAIVRPTNTVTFTTRYIAQKGKMDVTTDTSADYQSMDAKSHQFGETIDWNPIKQVYVQASGNLVYDTTSTAYPRAGGTGNDVLRNANNNYWTATALAGFVVDAATNVEVQFTHTSYDNYQPELAANTLPFGAGGHEDAYTIGIKRKLAARTLVNARLGYLDNHNDTSGGHTNYVARIAYVSVDQAF